MTRFSSICSIARVRSFLALAITSVFIPIPLKAQTEWQPQLVIDEVYAGIQHIHGYRATPQLIWGVDTRAVGGCGPVTGSHYCSRNHTVYITANDIEMAYQHGDAALAYIIGHEYAHAMQIAHGFSRGVGSITELQADCLSGFYLGVIPNITFDDRDIYEIASLAHRLGDYQWGSEHHHGTPDQRLQAVIWGIKSSNNGNGIRACLD
jgi:predicted metalloprotease